ncbi:MAG: IS110 family transposase [Clostridiales bacterium]|nr:IS110 family transposase [Clostridiales bacterium]
MVRFYTVKREQNLSGMEPTGHYWFNLGKYLMDNGMGPVLVNPHHVKKTKELDDNSPDKNDRKDPKTTAKLVNEGRYSHPYLPEGVYADLRAASNMRFTLTAELTRSANRIKKWFSVHFPEYNGVYSKFDAKSSMMLLKLAALPDDVVALGAEGINQIWRGEKMRGAGMKRAKAIAEAAEGSIGSREGLTAARMEIAILLEDYESKQAKLGQVMELIEELCKRVPMAGKLLEIKGAGIKTVSGSLAEVGDIRRFDNPKQLQKLAGPALAENSSGKHKGATKISKRGHKRLRHLLFEAALPLVAKNPEFRKLHHYYTTRDVNPLKKMQSLIAVACTGRVRAPRFGRNNHLGARPRNGAEPAPWLWTGGTKEVRTRMKVRMILVDAGGSLP